jgi:hypothetical protein
MTQDTHQQAIERYKDARDGMREQYDAMRKDLRFSDPTDPQQWDEDARKLRKGRPCLTFDRTNQFISQVVNAGRQQKPTIRCLPANSEAAIEVAEKLNGIIKHIEYVSRADIAYDTALEYAARIGIGWLRVVPEIMRPETNEQEIRIKRLADPLSVVLEAGWEEPDGSDAMHGFIDTRMTEAAFKRRWPKAKMQAWEGAGYGWFDDKSVLICEYLCIEETEENRLAIALEGQSMTVSEDEYWQLRQQTGIEIPATSFVAKVRSVKWRNMSGAEILDETEFPSQFLPIIPVIGHEIWVDGKRHLCGMTRRLMDSQRAYNYERSAFIESVAMQPKAPLTVPVQAMEGLEDHWSKLNQGNPAFLPFNHVDESGNPIPAPARLSPPAFPVAFAQGGQIASTDMESAVGMFRANLGAPGAATSGTAKREDKVAGDTANYHYTDNRNRSIAQLGRVVLDMIPRIFDTPRQARIMGDDDQSGFVGIDPEMQEPMRKEGKKVVSINPGIGAYDVRIKTGPAYTTMREESAEQLANMMQAAPDLMPILGDLWVGMQDWPEAETAKKRLAAMLPPQIQQMESEDGEEIPPAAQAQIAQMQQQMQQMQQALQEAQQAANAEMQKAQTADKDRALEMQRLTLEAIKLRNEKTAVDADAAEKMARAQNYGAEIQAKREESRAAIAQEYIRSESAVSVAKAAAESQARAPVEAPEKEAMSSALQSRIDMLEQRIAAMMEDDGDESEGEESSALATSVAQVAQMVAALSAQMQAQQPKQSMFRINKQADGSFVGTKTEH